MWGTIMGDIISSKTNSDNINEEIEKQRSQFAEVYFITKQSSFSERTLNAIATANALAEYISIEKPAPLADCIQKSRENISSHYPDSTFYNFFYATAPCADFARSYEHAMELTKGVVKAVGGNAGEDEEIINACKAVTATMYLGGNVGLTKEAIKCWVQKEFKYSFKKSTNGANPSGAFAKEIAELALSCFFYTDCYEDCITKAIMTKNETVVGVSSGIAWAFYRCHGENLEYRPAGFVSADKDGYTPTPMAKIAEKVLTRLDNYLVSRVRDAYSHITP